MSEISEKLPRREFLLATGAVALGATQAVHAAGKGHQHRGGAYSDLAQEAHHCVRMGEACLSHCIVDLQSGSLELVECILRVEELIAVCGAMATVAALDSEHVLAMVAVTKDVCITCEEECRKFADKHETCGDCADACLDCSKDGDRPLGSVPFC
jgi:Cys-rich four helix bundle protein (predicted Tat secretion target)